MRMVWFLCYGLLVTAAWTSAAEPEIPVATPAVRDERLQINLFASDPEIVTPIGLAIDASNRLYVVESHTHQPPRNYPGPKFDRIKRFEGRNGRADRITVFAEGLREAMTIALGAGGDLFVCCAREVLVLRDRDGDGSSDARERLLELETEERYAHNSLLGVALGPDGWLYVSRGNVAGHEYVLRGRDRSQVAGYGDGGNIVRCRPDGSQLELVATGFWNPFDLEFDYAGRLLAIDNDPDARGPNRLLHIVEGGDYGFKSLYGPSGLHPYNAWDGELPGTLPMIAGTGESPGGLLDCSRAALPASYRRDILVTSWAEHRVEQFACSRAGISLRADRQFLVEGGEFFRPVALESGPDGAIYITDWVLKDYPNHGKGRIWRLAARSGVEVSRPRPGGRMERPDSGLERFRRLSVSDSPGDYARLRAAARDADPFIRSAAVTALARPVYRRRLTNDLNHRDHRVRLGTLLALRRAGEAPAPAQISRLLRDPDPAIRRMTLIWVGETKQPVRPRELAVAIETEPVSPELLETFLATDQILRSPQEPGKKPRGFSIARAWNPQLIESLARDESKPIALRALALERMSDPDGVEDMAWLTRLAETGPPLLQLEAVRTLGGHDTQAAADMLNRIAHDRARSPDLRAEAILALSGGVRQTGADLIPLLRDPEPTVRFEAARGLRPLTRMPRVRSALEEARRNAAGGPGQAAWREALDFALAGSGSEVAGRPSSPAHWMAATEKGGDPKAGRRTFFSTQIGCAKCHRIAGRGGATGPDLSVIGRSVSRGDLLVSVLRPSDNVAPAYQAWMVETTGGDSYSGLQGHLRGGGAVTLMVPEGKTVTVPGNQVAAYRASNLSLMPEGLENTMTVSEVRDLLAFLESLR